MYNPELIMWAHPRPDATSVLKDKGALASLSRYFAVVKNEKRAKYLIARMLPAKFSQDESLNELWRKHEALTKTFKTAEKQYDIEEEGLKTIPLPEKSYLDLKIAIAAKILSNCHLCPRACGVDRIHGKLGYCNCGTNIMVSSIFAHMGEEPELVPSGTIFTMGCTMRCRHCQNYTISQWMENGELFKPNDLAMQVERLRASGCRNANLVGGEPTPWLQQWLETFKSVSVNVPVVWNSNSYYSPETAQLLTGFADVYLLDFKYGLGDCAERISDAPDYWTVCTRNHLEAIKHGEIIVRMLVLPNHVKCCAKPIMEWIAQNLGTETRVNIMFQYRPEWRAQEIPELQRRLNNAEKDETVRLAKQAGLTNFIT